MSAFGGSIPQSHSHNISESTLIRTCWQSEVKSLHGRQRALKSSNLETLKTAHLISFTSGISEAEKTVLLLGNPKVVGNITAHVWLDPPKTPTFCQHVKRGPASSFVQFLEKQRATEDRSGDQGFMDLGWFVKIRPVELREWTYGYHKGRMARGGIDGKFGIDMNILLYLKWITSKNLVYITGNYTQFYVIT